MIANVSQNINCNKLRAHNIKQKIVQYIKHDLIKRVDKTSK